MHRWRHDALPGRTAAGGCMGDAWACCTDEELQVAAWATHGHAAWTKSCRPLHGRRMGMLYGRRAAGRCMGDAWARCPDEELQAAGWATHWTMGETACSGPQAAACGAAGCVQRW
eukprot:354887-Chlamydomonas_euryale.AAC.8